MKTTMVLVLTLMIAVSAYGQDEAPPPGFNFDNIYQDTTIMGLVAKELGLDPNGVHMKNYRKNPYPEPDPDEIYVPAPMVKKHYKFNKGIEVPSDEELYSPILKNLMQGMTPPNPDDADKVPPQLRQLEKELPVVPRISPCIGGHTDKARVAEMNKEGGNQFDWMFIRDTSPEVDTDKYFGQGVAVFRVKDNSSSESSITAKALSVDCLPMRFRGTKAFMYKHQGLDALKNYDTNLDGKGELHDEVEKQKPKFY